MRESVIAWVEKAQDALGYEPRAERDFHTDIRRDLKLVRNKYFRCCVAYALVRTLTTEEIIDELCESGRVEDLSIGRSFIRF